MKFYRLRILISALTILLITDHSISNTCHYYSARDQRCKISNHIRIATYSNPLARIPNVSSGNIGFMERELLDWISKDLNFTFDIVVPKDILQLGIRQFNGSWTGALGLLRRGEADLSISFGPRNLQRYLAFDVTSAVLTDNIGIMVPYPNIGIRPSGFIDIFTPMTWWLIFLGSLAVTSCIWYIGRNFKPEDHIDYGSLSLYLFGVLLNQGGWIRANSVAYNFVYGSWLLSLLVILYGYQGTLISKLSAPFINYVATSLDDVAADESIMPFTLKESATHSEFRDSLLPQFKSVNQRFESYPELLLTNTTNAVGIILNRTRSVLIISDIIIDNEIKRDYENTGACRALLLKKKVQVRRNGLFLRKNSDWTHAIDNQILLLRQHGLGQHLEEKYKTYTKTRCIVDEQSVRTREYNGPLTFSQLKGAFYLLGVGLFLASLAFLAEAINYRVMHEMNKAEQSVSLH